MTKREEGKALRRDRILDAMLDLLRDVDATELTTHQIAAAAGCAQATIFNLFGSKANLIHALLERDRALIYARLSSNAGRDSLDQLLQAGVVLAQSFQDNPNLYRMLFLTDAHRTKFIEINFAGFFENIQFWRDLIDQAIADDYIMEDCDSELLASSCEYLTTGALYSWISNTISVAQLSRALSYAIANLLVVYASPSTQGRLLTHIRMLKAAETEGDRAVESKRPDRLVALSASASRI